MSKILTRTKAGTDVCGEDQAITRPDSACSMMSEVDRAILAATAGGFMAICLIWIQFDQSAANRSRSQVLLPSLPPIFEAPMGYWRAVCLFSTCERVCRAELFPFANIARADSISLEGSARIEIGLVANNTANGLVEEK